MVQPGGPVTNPERDIASLFEDFDESALDPAALTPDAAFDARLREIGVELDDTETAQLGRYLAMLLWANTRLNLTGIKSPSEAWDRHIADALTLLAPISELASEIEGARGARTRLIDVGSGGGVPGIPLAIALPALKVRLVESTQKKCAFLEWTARRLGLRNVAVTCERAERTGTSDLRESFDIATARALGPLSVVCELTLPLVRVGGLALLVKGAKADEELDAAKRAIALLGAAHAGTLETPTGRIVVLEKRAPTPRTYPRREGEPKRAPL
jgi:16S rRNA (guanine527-N7)-methyltransferase